MTDMTYTQQQQIFHQPLEMAEQKAVSDLVRQNKTKMTLTQQLALDASKLISTSQERLQDQANSGFLKRFWSAVSGKNTENIIINQSDTLHIQRMAWHYLMQLQQQNLINSQSIAIIRNNLGIMNEYIIETRDFLEQAIDKINHRLIHLENNTRFNNWSLEIEANKRRYRSYPSAILILTVAYDFMRRHQDAELVAADINYLIVTLEKLGVNCDEEIRLLDFIIELIDQIDIISMDRYRSLIELTVDEHEIDSHFIQTNISGIGFNALYFLSEQYDKIVSLIDDDALCNSDEAREKLISRLFGEAFSGLSTIYSIRDLISEVIGGSLLTIDIYRDINGLNANEIEDMQYDSTEVLTLVSALPDIRQHSFLDSTDSEEKKSLYLRLIALSIESSISLSKSSQEFLALLGEYAGCPSIVEDIYNLAEDPYKYQEYHNVISEVLVDDNARYTWLFDVFFLLTLSGKKVENPQIMRLLSILKPTKFKESLPHMLALLQEHDQEKLLTSAAELTLLTQGWNNIFRYRDLRFEEQFSETIRQLGNASFACTKFSLDMLQVTMKFSDYSFFMGSFDDEGFLSKVGSAVGSSACALGRKSCLSSLNDLRKKACDFLTTNSSALNKANRITSSWGLPTFEYDNQISYSDYQMNNSVENEDWYDEISDYEAQIDNSLTAFSNACTDAIEQLELFSGGEFGKSIIRIKEQKHIEWLQQREFEKIDKQSVTVVKGDKRQRFRIEWQDIQSPPCDPENIRHIKTDGQIWLVVDTDACFYRSEDGKNWQVVTPDSSEKMIYVSRIIVVEGNWVVFTGSDSGFYYSSDALNWHKSQFPDVPNTWDFRFTEDLVYFNNLWLWRFKESKEYFYKEEGFFFDSTKTSTYYKPVIFCTNSLDEKWRRYEHEPNFSEGIEMERLCSLPGVNCLLAFCKYDSLYISVKKRPKSESIIEYHVPGKNWRTCTWNGEKEFYSDILISRMNGSLMCFYSSYLFTSKKGYEWKPHDSELRVADCFHLSEISLFPSSYYSNVIYLSHDGVDFKELMMDEGNWQYLAANEKGLLSVYSPNSHETYLRMGNYIWQS